MIARLMRYAMLPIVTFALVGCDGNADGPSAGKVPEKRPELPAPAKTEGATTPKNNAVAKKGGKAPNVMEP